MILGDVLSAIRAYGLPARAVSFAKAERRRDEDWADLVDRLAAQFEPGMAAAFVAACQALRDKTDVEALAAAIQVGDMAAVEAAIGLTGASYVGVFEHVRDAFEAGAQAAAEFYSAPRITVSFELLNPRTDEFLATYGMNLIREISEETRRAIQAAVRQGVVDGIPPAEIARDVREVVGYGLTEKQAQAIMNFQAELERGDPAALKRALRDRRFDPTVTRMLQTGEPLSREQVNRMVGRYEERWRKFRAEMIARTESLRATNMGAFEAIRQSAERGDIPADAVIRRWIIARDERTCPICKAIPGMDDAGRGLLEDFATPAGAKHLPPAHPMCRCAVTLTIGVD